MKSTFLRSLGLSSVPVLGFAAAAALGGCSGADVESPADQGSPAPADSGAVADYILHVQPSKGRVTLRRLSKAALEAQASHRGPGLAPQVMADANLTQDGVEGSNNGSTSNNTVELVTGNTVDTYNTAAQGNCPANSFCADVVLNSFWTQTLNNTFVQVTSLTDSNGMPFAGHSGTNSDSPRSTGLSSSLGLWMYQSPAVSTTHFSNGSSGVMLPGTANGATKTWVFANPDDADTYVQLKVWASTSYSKYTLTSRTATYNDACTPGTGESALIIGSATNGALFLGQPINRNDGLFVQLPFDFTFWGTHWVAGDHLNFSKWGQLTFGPTSYSSATGLYSANMPSNTTAMKQATADKNTALPLATSPRPGAFVFWDALKAASSGTTGMCAKQSGTAPNRQVHITWYREGLAGGGPFLIFGATLNESTDEIWFNYSSQTGAATYSATIGAQDDKGTTAATNSVTNVTSFPAGTSKVLLPLP